MNPARRAPVTMSAGLGIGVALGLAGMSERRAAPENEAPLAEGAFVVATESAAAGSGSTSVPGSSSSSTEAYAAAWDLLKDGKLTKRERRRAESELLQEWSKVDLRSALQAAFEGDWSDPDDPFDTTPIRACLAEIGRQPDLVWSLISSREFGLHTRDLREAWIRVLAVKRPREVLRRLPELPSDLRSEAVYAVVVTTHRRDRPAPGKEEVAATLRAFHGTPDEAVVMEGYAGGIASTTEGSELSALLLNSPDAAMREVYLMAYVMGIQAGDSRQVALDVLPADIRAEVESRLDSMEPEFKGWSLPSKLFLPPGD